MAAVQPIATASPHNKRLVSRAADACRRCIRDLDIAGADAPELREASHLLEDISLQLRVLGLYHDRYHNDPRWNHNTVAGCLGSLLDGLDGMSMGSDSLATMRVREMKAFKGRVQIGLCALREQEERLEKTVGLLSGPEQDGGFPLPDMADVLERHAEGVSLLAIDGGGVRGLVSLRVLKAIMDEINRGRGTSKPKMPTECFKLTGGTSTGGLICIMLFRLGMSIDEAIISYKTLSQTMFQPSFISKYLGGTFFRTMFGLSWYEGSSLEDAVRDKVIARGLEKDATFLGDDFDPDADGCKVFVTSLRSRDNFAVRFRSYRLPDGSLPAYSSATIVQAARATSAAPFYFPPATIGNTEFWDGALANNNPVDELWAEKSLAFSSQRSPSPAHPPHGHDISGATAKGKGTDKKRAIRCVLSLGTGKFDPSRRKRSWIASHPAISKGAQLLENLTNVENVHRRFDELMRAEGVWYFRFNPPTTEDVDLAEYRREKLAQLEADVEKYLKRPHVAVLVKLCAQLLR